MKEIEIEWRTGNGKRKKMRNKERKEDRNKQTNKQKQTKKTSWHEFLSVTLKGEYLIK